jgi:hypothetical protein
MNLSQRAREPRVKYQKREKFSVDGRVYIVVDEQLVLSGDGFVVDDFSYYLIKDLETGIHYRMPFSRVNDAPSKYEGTDYYADFGDAYNSHYEIK